MAKKKDTLSEYSLILSDLKRKNYKPVYFLCGEEGYYIDKLADYIEHHVLDEGEKSFNQSVLYGRDITIEQVVSEAKRFPMMAERTVVLIKEAQNLKDIEALENYVKQPSPTTLLVICYKYKKPDGRKSFAKSIKEKSVYFESDKIYDNQVPDWVEQYVKGKGYSIKPDASRLIGDSLGADLSKVSNELEKLFINVPQGTDITTELVQKHIGISKDFNVFELQNALGVRNVLKANQIINYFAANPKEHPFLLIPANLYSYFTKLMLTHKTEDKSKLASILGVHPFFVKDYETAARNYPPGKLVEIMGILREYDLKSKGVDSGDTEDGDLMKELIFKILH